MSLTQVDNFANFELINKENYFKFCLYDRSEGENNDEITPDGYAKWASLIAKEKITIRDYLKKYPTVSIVSKNIALKLQQKYYEKKYNAYKPYVITRNIYWEKLEVLPPEEWTQTNTIRNHKGKQYKYYFESFKLIECLAENLYNYYGYLRMNDKTRYFGIVLPSESSPELIETYCFKHFLKLGF